MGFQKLVFCVAVILLVFGAVSVNCQYASDMTRCRNDVDCLDELLVCEPDSNRFCYEERCYCQPKEPMCWCDEDCAELDICWPVLKNLPNCINGLCLCSRQSPASPAPAPTPAGGYADGFVLD